MTNTQEILLDDTLNPESKVWLIARVLKEENRLWDDLWYAILDMKEEHWNDIMTRATAKYLPLNYEVSP